MYYERVTSVPRHKNRKEMMSDQTPIKVIIVDDHAVVRSGLSAFLMVFDDLEFVGEAVQRRGSSPSCARI